MTMATYCCGPGAGGSFYGRRYWTREEKLEWLKEYADELEAELKGVRERLAELKKEER